MPNISQIRGDCPFYFYKHIAIIVSMLIGECIMELQLSEGSEKRNQIDSGGTFGVC